MSESSGKEEQVKDPSRRNFLKTIGKLTVVGVGVVALGGMVANEVSKSENGIVTESGIFFPLYELHEKGIKVESIPDGLDVFFRESVIDQQSLFAPEYILRASFIAKGKEVNLLPREILAYLSQQKTEVILGSTVTPGMVLSPVFRKNDEYIMGGEILAGAALAAGLLATRRNKIDLKAGIGRRKFLKAVMLAGVAWGLLKIPTGAGALMELHNKKPIDRIYSRLVSIESHMHPELSMIFFRNIVMADKLLTVSENIRERTGQKAKIAFQVGAFHTGIEDFLQAGHDFCRNLILAYPKWYLRSTVKLNNGIRDFSSDRLFKLPENLTVEDMANGEKLKETTERRVVDEKLEKALTLKLA